MKTQLIASTIASALAMISAGAPGNELKTVTSILARVQGDTPEWNAEHGMYMTIYGDNFEAKWEGALDTVNFASVEGALMYVQAEGINVRNNGCIRKNKMANIVFYEMKIKQPKAAMDVYDSSGLHELGPFIAMDDGTCTATNSQGDRPKACHQFGGTNGQEDLGLFVGGDYRETDRRAPYPNNIWYSIPNSCYLSRFSDKDKECRTKFPGGVCAYGQEPGGKCMYSSTDANGKPCECLFSYEILGYLPIDDLVGITDMGYANYKEFCEDGKVEFWCDGFNNQDCTPTSDLKSQFWANPFDEKANAERAKKMIDKYNEYVKSHPNMKALPSKGELWAKNPPCSDNTDACPNETSCRRDLYAQICVPCSNGENCTPPNAPSGGGSNSRSSPGSKPSSASGSDGTHPGHGSCPNTENDVDYPGNDIATIWGVELDKCCDICASDAGCNAFAYVRDSGMACYLKSAGDKSKKVQKSGVVSAVLSESAASCPNSNGKACGNRAGVSCCTSDSACVPWDSGFYQCISVPEKCPVQETDVDYPGNDLRTIKDIHPWDCCSECSKDSQCKAYTFVNSNIDGRSACYLKSGFDMSRRAEVKGALSSILVN